MDDAYEQQKAVFIPPGVYKITDTLECQRDLDAIGNISSRVYGCQIVGSTADALPILRLVNTASGFDNTNVLKPVLLFRSIKDGNVDPSNGYISGVRNLHIEVGSNNAGAVAYWHEGAQENIIMNLKITMQSGYAGLYGLVGTNSVLNGIEIEAGAGGAYQYGIVAPNTVKAIARWPVLTDLTISGQTERAIFDYESESPLTIAGFDITQESGSVIETISTFRASGGNITFIDGVFHIATPSNDPVIDNSVNKNIILQNVYFDGGRNIIQSGSNLLTGDDGWSHIDQYANPHETVGATFINGTVGSAEVVGTVTVGEAPAVDLNQRHGIDLSYYPSPDVILDSIANNDDTPNDNIPIGTLGNGLKVVNVADFEIIGVDYSSSEDTTVPDHGQAIQDLIDDPSIDVLFFPAGYYPIKQTLVLNGSTHLTGIANYSSHILGHKEWLLNNPGTVIPLIETVDSAEAAPRMSFLHLQWETSTDLNKDWFGGLHWRAGSSEVVSVMMLPNWGNVGAGNPRIGAHFTGNGGGRWFGAGWFFNGNRNTHPDYRKLLIEGTSQPLIIYGLNVEDGKGDYQIEISNAANVLLIGTKTENSDDILINNSQNVIAFSWGGDETSMHFVDSEPVLAALIAPKNSTQGGYSLQEDYFGASMSNPFEMDVITALFKRGEVDFSVFFDDDAVIDPTVTPTPTYTPIPGDCTIDPTNLVSNSSFENGELPWYFYSDTSSTDNNDFITTNTDAHHCDFAAKVSVNPVGNNVQLYQDNLNLQPNTSYSVSFSARATGGRDLSVSLLRAGENYFYGLNNHYFDLSSSWQSYTVEFTTSGFAEEVFDGRFRFWLAPYAQAGDEYWIDNVELVAAEGTPITSTFTPTPTSTATATITPTPTNTPTPMPSGGSLIEIFAAGRDGVEDMTLFIDGNSVATYSDVGGDYRSGVFEYFTYTHVTAVSPNQVRVGFTDASTGRNLWIDKIIIDGQTYQSEDAYTTGTWTSGDGCAPGVKQAEVLHLPCHGYFDYDPALVP